MLISLKNHPMAIFLSLISCTPPENQYETWTWTPGRGDSVWKPSFYGSILVFDGWLSDILGGRCVQPLGQKPTTETIRHPKTQLAKVRAIKLGIFHLKNLHTNLGVVAINQARMESSSGDAFALPCWRSIIRAETRLWAHHGLVLQQGNK